MVVRQTLPSDVVDLAVDCDTGPCYRVELYNYVLNLTTVAMVDVEKGEVLAVNHLSNVQPDISPELTELAVQIAMNSPEVMAALGMDPTPQRTGDAQCENGAEWQPV